MLEKSRDPPAMPCRRPDRETRHAAFLRALARHGNAREAARALGLNRATLTRRRAADPAFAARWERALAVARERLAARAPDAGTRLVRLASGRVQRRRRPPRALGRAAEQAFLLALSATANVRLAAAAAGFSHSAFYARRREDPAFAREMQAALAEGYGRVEAELLAAGLEGRDGAETDDWRRNDSPAVPPMTANQALQLLHLHQKEARLDHMPERMRRRRGEPEAAWHERLTQMGEHRLARGREASLAAERARRAEREPAPPQPALPDLAQVGGWSRADPTRIPHDAERALFGGWRLDRLTPEQMAKARKRQG